MADPDPLEGQEIALLNQALAALQAKVKAGEEAAIDRMIKILELKRKYREDRLGDSRAWKAL